MVIATAATRPGIMVYEKSVTWTRLLRRRMDQQWSVMRGPSLCDWPSFRQEVPSASLFVVGKDDWQRAAECVNLLRQHDATALVLVVLSAPPSGERLLRCAGATMVWRRSAWPVAEICDLIRRFYSKMPSPTLSLEERIWKNLPWEAVR